MRPTLEQILDATLLVEGMEYDYWLKRRPSRSANVCQVKRVIAYFGRSYGYTQRELASFLSCSIPMIACAKKKQNELLEIYRDEREKIENIESLLEKSSRSRQIEGWVARDEDGGISFFFEKPTISSGVWTSRERDYSLSKDLFPYIKTEDGPLKCELILNLK